jgi:predicted TPR repeat methyltransferase
MATHPTRVRLIGPPQADGEYVGLRAPGADREEIVHLHSYERIYGIPGLYEHIVQELLRCSSPQVAADALAGALTTLEIDPARLRLLDLGAGTGLVGELVRGLGVETVIGLDSLAAARAACLRDRPRIYADYLVGNLAPPGPSLLERLRAQRVDGLIAAGAFGGTHMPGSALARALGLLPDGAPVVFTIAEQWTASDGPGGFRTPLAELVDSGRLRLLERSRFEHRITTTGEPIFYELVVASTAVTPPAPPRGFAPA